MVVDLGETQVFVRKMPQPGQRLIYAH
jgi:hypothetical protein